MGQRRDGETMKLENARFLKEMMEKRQFCVAGKNAPIFDSADWFTLNAVDSGYPAIQHKSLTATRNIDSLEVYAQINPTLKALVRSYTPL